MPQPGAAGCSNPAKRPRDQPAREDISLCVRDQVGVKKFYNINRDEPIGGILRTFCREMKLEYNEVRFFYDCKRLRERETPQQLGMDDGDKIDAMMHQSGGGH